MIKVLFCSLGEVLLRALFAALAFVLMSGLSAQSQNKVDACQTAVEEAIQIRNASQKAYDEVHERYQKSKGLEFDRLNCENQKAAVADMEIALETALYVEKVCGKRLAARAFPKCDSACWRKWIVSEKELAKSSCDNYEEALKTNAKGR